MDASASSSKVTVEYHDPSGVFPLVVDEISKRLPLRNLNWQSPARPLRQIKSLHVEFVADNETQSTLRPPTARQEANGPNSFEIVSGGADSNRNSVKERRHQIPGLKKSPYLKIYILRSDDSDSYKDTDRKQVRDWVREISGLDGHRDSHNAFEWMILHVVIPDTVAASEPRWRDSTSKDSDELRERPKSNSKWPGKGGRTVFDRLRADFNELSKSGQDRVAQIRLLKSQIAPDLLPTPAIAPTLEESPQEQENAWIDLITKFKTFILNPFDIRVRQYEADVAEQESRRAFPGWNFCTFFIHKEGLANALESIGLVQDALAIYDELSVGLEAVVQDVTSGRAAGTATNFASFTSNIQYLIDASPEAQMNGATNVTKITKDNEASGLFSKDYRRLIVTSDISIFDFLCYIFSRQRTLLLRLANTQSTQQQFGEKEKSGREDLALISEVCWRTSNFIHVTARTLRQDLKKHALARPSDGSLLNVDHLTHSWVYMVASQVLQETNTSILQDRVNPSPKAQTATTNGVRRRTTMTLGLGADAYPQRSTSLPGRRSHVPELKRPVSRSGSGGSDAFRPQSTPGSDLLKSPGAPGLVDLAARRAELILLCRKTLEKAAARHGWYAGLASIENYRSVRTDADEVLNEPQQTPPSSQGLESLCDVPVPSLSDALQDRAAFRRSYEKLTDLAILHYTATKQTNSLESLKCDMTILKTQSLDYSTALSYFEQIVPHALHRSSLLDLEVLRMYSVCLKQQQRSDAYVKVILELLSKACGGRLERNMQCMTFTEDSYEKSLYYKGMLTDLAESSAPLPQDLTVAAEKYFTDIQLSEKLDLRKGRDGFSLCLSFQHVLDDNVEIEPSARLISVDEPSHDIWLCAERPVALKTGLNVVDLHTSVVACGAFFVEKIILTLGKIRFEQNLKPKAEEASLTTAETRRTDDTPKFRVPPYVYVYPAENAFNSRIQQAKHTEIGKPKRIEVILESGRNEVRSMQLKIKPGSAGLRLHLADASCSGIGFATEENTVQGQLNLGTLPSGEKACVSVPFSLEQDTKEIGVRLEVQYLTLDGLCTFLSSQSIINTLPLDVDVDDNFHLDVLYSQFTVRAIDEAPLSITGAQLDESDIYSIRPPRLVPLPTTVYSSQPMQLTYQIRRNPQMPKAHTKRNAALILKIQYQSINDVFQQHLEGVFTQDLRVSAYVDLTRLLTSILTSRSKNILNSADLEMATVLGKVKIPSFDEIGWIDILSTLHDVVRAGLEVWLRSWHDNAGEVDLYEANTGEATTKTLMINVDVPNVDIVFSCSLSLNTTDNRIHRGSPIILMGSPVQATVRVKHTNAWHVEDTTKSASNNLTFACEIIADPDTWLVGGQRRCHFKPNGKDRFTIEIVLIPLQIGRFALPLVNIQLSSNDDGSRTENSISYETVYESAGKVVQVIHDTRRSRVDIAESFSPPNSPPLENGTTLSSRNE